jgi:predicted dehydrogenase
MVAMALAAGKHVYCEWPLARNTDEAQRLLDLANNATSVTQIGLQARHAPALVYARDLIREGVIGNLHSAHLNHSVDWMPMLPSSLSYLQDFDSGAHMLSIPGGHSLDTLRWLSGDITELSAMVATRVEDVLMVDTGKTITRSSPDQVLVHATTGDGVLISLRVQGSSPLGSGVTLELNGDEGDLVVKCGAGARGIQMSDLTLYKTVAGGQLEKIDVPEHYFEVNACIRHNPALNVAKSYIGLAKAIQQGEPVPDFHTALSLHQLLDNIMVSSQEHKFTSGKSSPK